MRIRIIGAQGDGALQHGDAFRRAAIAVVEDAQLVGGFGVGRIDPEGTFEEADGLVVPARQKIEAAQGGEGGRHVRVGGDHGFKENLGFVVAAAAVFDETFDELGLGRVAFRAGEEFRGAIGIAGAALRVGESVQDAAVPVVLLIRDLQFREGFRQLAGFDQAEAEKLVGAGFAG